MSSPDRTVLARVERLFPPVLGLQPPSPTTDLIDGGYLDSLGLVELLHALEQEFGIEIPLEELEIEEFRTAERIAAFAVACGAVDAGDAP